MKRLVAIITGLSMCIGSFNYVQAEENDTVIIYHTNDVHGYVEGDGESIIGIDTVAALKESTPGAILADAGDATQGLPIASLSKGADIIELMNMAGYDVMAAGNHEFDFGADNFIENVKRADFPVLSANIFKDGSLLLDGVQEGNKGCHTIIESNGVKVGFFGLTTVDTASATNPQGIKGITFEDEIECAKREIDELNEEGADVIIAICHLGNMGVECMSTDIAEAMTGEYQNELDAIIDGHSHTVENIVVNDVLIAQTGTGMTGLGKLSVNVSGDDVSVSEKLLSAADVADVVPKAEVSEKINEINMSQQDILSEKIGSTDTTLWAGWIGDVAPVRFVETNYGDMAADALKYAAENFLEDKDRDMPVVAVENGGGIREALPKGDITKGSLIAAFPFSNTVYLKEVTPNILYGMMEVSGSLLDGQDPETGMLLQMAISGGFLQISGFSVVFDPDSKGDKVISITLDGENKPLDRNDDTTKIMLAGNNYILSGGNDYTMLADIPVYGEAGGEVEAIESYIESIMVNGKLEGYKGDKDRIVMKGQYEPNEYTAYINIADENGKPLLNSDVYYSVDGGEKVKGVTDEKGLLAVKLQDGPHGISMGDNEVYVNNYTGIGIIEDSIRTFPALEYIKTDVSETTTETTTAKEENVHTSGGAGGSLNINPYGDTQSTAEEMTETTTEEISEAAADVVITIGESTVTIGDETVETGCVPYIKDGCAMVPLRSAALAVWGLDVERGDESSAVVWDGVNKKAVVSYNGTYAEFRAGSSAVNVNGSVIEAGTSAEIKEGRMYVPFRAVGEALGVDVVWISESKSIHFAK